MITICSTASLRVFKTALGNLAHRLKESRAHAAVCHCSPDVVVGKRADA